MEKFMALLEKTLVPVAVKISGQRHMMSIKDAFIAMMPITLVGSMALLVNVLVKDLPNMILGEENQVTAAFDWLIAIDGAIWWGTLAMMALVFAFSLGYNLAKNANLDPLPGAITAIAIFIVTIPQTVPVADAISTAAETAGEPITTTWGGLDWTYLNAGGIFTAMIMVILGMEIYRFLMVRNVTIKMPEQVPPNVASAFTAFIPALIAIYFSAIVAFVVLTVSGSTINMLISEFIMTPLMNIGQGYIAVIIMQFLTQLLWFFGIHGMNVLTPVYESIWGVAQLANIDAFALGKEIPYLWTRLSFDLYANFGGAGATFGLIVSMFVFGRRKETKVMRNIATGPGIFNINEPLIFGLPIILNPIYFIPWLIIPLVTITIGYFATVTGFAGPVVAAIPWVTPIGFSAILATAGSIGALITQLICVVVAILLWAPFVIIAERQADKIYGKEAKEDKN